MTDLVPWLLVAELVGLAAFPLVYRAFPRLADRGFGLTIPAGMLVLSTLAWLLGYAHVLPNSALGWWIALFVVAAGGVAAVRTRLPELLTFFRRRWPVLAMSQAMFIGFFLLFALLRANDPNITNTEKPMEILMFNAAVSSEYAPPEDPWLSGETVAYYYGSYWNMGGIATMSGVPTAHGFNLSLALIAGMSASAIFSLVYSMVGRDGGRKYAAVSSGVLASVLLLMVASLAGWWELAAHMGVGSAGFYEWLSIDGLRSNPDPQNWRPDQFWWWFRASRIINTFDETGVGQDFTIQEFPAFSFVLGDLHPHVISIPFVLVGIAAAFNLFISTDRWGWDWLRKNAFSAVAIGLIFGAAGFINQADILLTTALFGSVVILKTYGESGRSLLRSVALALPPLAVVAVAGVIMFSPFYFGTLGGQLQSPPIAPAEFGSRPVHFLTVWGLFVVLLAPFALLVGWPLFGRYAGAAWRARSRSVLAPNALRNLLAEARYAEDDKRPIARTAATEQSLEKKPGRMVGDIALLKRLDRGVWAIPVVLLVVPYLFWIITHLGFNDLANGTDFFTRLSIALPLGIAFFVLFFVTVRKAHYGATPSSLFVLLLATIVVYMLFGAELWFVHDLFGNRMNTVFKFYYQAWIMLSVVAGYGVFHWARAQGSLKGKPLLASRTAAVALAVLLIGPVWWSVAAGVSKAEDYTGPMTLDGWAFLERTGIADAVAIEFLLNEADERAHIVEAVGGGYSEYGRISAATGLPAVLGWPGHERQWRGTDDLFRDREQDVRDIYEAELESTTRSLLDKYEVTYVVVGPRERARYPLLDASKFDSLGEKVFEAQGISIYNVRGQAS